MIENNNLPERPVKQNNPTDLKMCSQFPGVFKILNFWNNACLI